MEQLGGLEFLAWTAPIGQINGKQQPRLRIRLLPLLGSTWMITLASASAGMSRCCRETACTLPAARYPSTSTDAIPLAAGLMIDSHRRSSCNPTRSAAAACLDSRSPRLRNINRNAEATRRTSCSDLGSLRASDSSAASRAFARDRSTGARADSASWSPSASATIAHAERADSGRPGSLRSAARSSESSSTTHCEPIGSARSYLSAILWRIREHRLRAAARPRRRSPSP